MIQPRSLPHSLPPPPAAPPRPRQVVAARLAPRLPAALSGAQPGCLAPLAWLSGNLVRAPAASPLRRVLGPLSGVWTPAITLAADVTSRTVRAAAPAESPTASPTGQEGQGGTGQLYIVTGATGFLGEHLVRQLLAEGGRVRVLCRSPSSFKAPAPAAGDPLPHQGTVQVVAGSIEDAAALESLFQYPEAQGEELGTAQGAQAATAQIAGVFHLAGVVEHSQRRAQHVEDVNLSGTLNVLKAAKKAGVRRVVYASTSGVAAVSADPAYVAGDDAPYAEDETKHWPYYHSKVEAEKAAREYAAEAGIELICMRPTLLLGPGDRRLSSCRTVADLLARRIPLLPSGGLSFVDVRDTASAFVSAMKEGAPGATYLLGACNMTLRDFFRLVEKVSGVPGPWLQVPTPLAWMLASVASTLLCAIGRWNPTMDPVLVEMSSQFWYLNGARAKEELGFSPRDPESTVADTVAWLRANWDSLG